jgi:hypothetical protein
MKGERRSRKPSLIPIFLLLTLSCLISWNCRTKTIVSPVLIGEARIAGTIEKGEVKWEPKEIQSAQFYIVTPAFVKVCLGLALENSELKAEIKKLQTRREE